MGHASQSGRVTTSSSCRSRTTSGCPKSSCGGAGDAVRRGGKGSGRSRRADVAGQPRSHPETLVCSAGAKQDIAAISDQCKEHRSYPRSLGVRRWGQRKRQLYRSKGLHGQRCLPKDCHRSGEGQDDPVKRSCRTWCDPSSNRWEPSQKVHGEESATVRSQTAVAFFNGSCRRLVPGISEWQRRDVGLSGEAPHVLRTGGHRWWPPSTGVAPDGAARFLSAHSVRQEGSRPEAFQPTCSSELDIGEPSIFERPGLSRSKNAKHRPTCRPHQNGSGTDRRCRSQTEAKTQTKERRKGLAEPGGRVAPRKADEPLVPELIPTRLQSGPPDCDAVPESHPAKQFSDNIGSFCTESEVSPWNVEDILDDHFFRGSPSPFDLHSPDEFATQVFDPLDLVGFACSSISSIHTGLTHFIRQSLLPVDTRKFHMPVRQACLWPVPPPPRWCWTGSSRLNPRRRRLRRFFRLRRLLLQQVVCCLNWIELGHPCEPPSSAQLGAPISDNQRQILRRLESMLDHYLKVEPFTGEELGRSCEKFQNLILMLKELPRCNNASGFEDLITIAQSLHHEFDSYGSHFLRRDRPDPPDSAPHSDCAFETMKVKEKPLGSKPVVASRVKWEYPPSFHAERFLDDPLCQSAFRDPEVLRKAPEDWSRSVPAKVHCSKSELLELATRWDNLGACDIVSKQDINWDEAVGLFCVPKDAKHDRLIINPTVVNGRMHSLNDATRNLAPGAMLSLLSLKDHEMFRFNADDLSDYYYTFVVSSKRSKRNAIRMEFSAHEIAHLSCYRESLGPGPFAICLKTLAMGDNLAVEIAQSAHTNVLRQLAGSMLEHETLRYRHPCPRTDFVELLAIDDHIGIQKLHISDFPNKPVLRDTEVFKAAEWAYKHVGLVQHERKRKRNQTQGILLGADFDGSAGKVMAPRSRLYFLSLLSLVVAHRGTCTRQLLQILLGCWVHALLFRRPLFALMDHLFKDCQNRSANQVFCLHPKSRNELILLALLSPTAQSDLRAKYCPKIFTMDASPTGGAVCAADLGSTACKEIWRHTEQRGYYTRLQSPVSSLLTEKGLDSEVAEQFGQKAPDVSLNNSPFVEPSIPCSLEEGILYDAVEIFRGSGNWSAVHGARGLTMHDGFDIDSRRLRFSDLSDRAVFRELVSLAARKVVREWHAGLPCVSWGTLRRPQVRSISQPYGFNPEDPFTAYHNLLAIRTAMILTIALLGGQFISLEQPGSSRLFHLDCYKVLIALGCVISHFTFCAYGSGFRKASKWLHNKPWLIPLESSCTCHYKGNHFTVQGTFTKASIADFDHRCVPSCTAVYGRNPKVGESVASFSASYPVQLVHRMASGALSAKRGIVPKVPQSVRLRTYKEVNIFPNSLIDCFVGPSTEKHYPPRPWFEDPEWIGEICESLHFRECFRYTFKRANHINVNEARTYKSWIKSLAKSHPDHRALGILDSRVTLGAAAKGRSSSAAISHVLGSSLAYIIGGGLYPGGLHCYSDFNRADGPSRGRPIAAPSKAIPGWLESLQNGDPRPFDCVVAASRVPKIAARWLRFLLLLGGDIEINPGPPFSKGRFSGNTCGFPAPRGKLDLTVGFSAATSNRMTKCLEAFRQWCEASSLPWDSLVSSPEALAWALRGYGMHLFEVGLPRYLLVYSITACQDMYPACKSYTTVAWQVDKKWQVYEPGQCRAVLPAMAIRASVCIAALWGWFSWLGCLLLGFSAMLHPSEIVSLIRKDLIFPKDVAYDSMALYVHIKNPKTSRFARRQHGRVDDPEIISVLEALFFTLPLSDRLYHGSLTTFRKQWDAVMVCLGIPHRQDQRGATPGTLRGSGATFLYSGCEDPAWIAWRGRWSRVRTLEYYLQEVAAQLLIHELSPVSRSKIQILSNSAWHVLASVLSLRGSK